MAAEANLSLFRQHAAVILARLSAERLVKKRIRAEGRIPLSTIPAARIARLANEWLEAHPELLAEAAADPIVLQISQVSFKRRKPAAQGLPVCKSQERNGGPR
jgi:hypothetical protein